MHPTFKNRYKVNKVNSFDDPEPNSAKNLIHVVVDQGEGQRIAGGAVPNPNLDHDEYTEPAEGSRFYAQDHLSHLGRFQKAQAAISKMKFYPAAPYNESTATAL